MRVQAQPGYVLYARPYSESSWVLAVFTRAYGRFVSVHDGDHVGVVKIVVGLSCEL